LAVWLPAIDPSAPNAAAKQPSVTNLRKEEFDTFMLETPIFEAIMSVVGSVSVHNAGSSINPAWSNLSSSGEEACRLIHIE
jgi:hypothetical protein